MRKILIILLLSMIFVAPAMAEQNFYGTGAQKSATFVDYQRYYSSDDGTGTSRLKQYWPIFSEMDPAQCEGRQDLILQVSPFGCQPSVVRSDLLAEQNVPVFCQLDAIRLNPLIDIKQIRNIRFVGNYPDEVVGAGFHPAKAALRTRNELVGSPLINNIGYVVLVMKRNPVESKLPNFVNVTLRARVDYYAGNVLGIGRTQFILQPVSEDEWKVERNKQSFYQGRYSVRLLESDPERAVIALYRGDVRISSAVARKGQPSSDIYLPGAYCQAGLKVHYDGLQAAENIAKIQVGEDTFEVYEGSKFLNNRCTVRAINVKEGEDKSVDFTCGSERFTLAVSLKTLEKGERVYFYDFEKNKPDTDRGVWIIDNVDYVSEKDGQEKVVRRIVSYDLKNSDDEKIQISNVSVANLSSFGNDKLTETVYNASVEKYFKDTINTYKQLADDYPLEKDGVTNANLEGVKTFGEQGLERAIGLAEDMRKEATAVELINLYMDIYPDSANSSYFLDRLNRKYRFDLTKSATTVEADNEPIGVRLIEIKVPTKRSKATFNYGTIRDTVELYSTKDIGAGTNITLRKADEKSAQFMVSCGNEKKTATLRIGEDGEEVCGSILRLVDTDIESYAKIRLEPVARGPTVETNVTVGVGIEKRAIKLTPDKARDRIAELNKTIERWDKISTSMGNVVKGMKAACFATAGVLTVKNFVTGLDGSALARQKVMRGPDGWTEWCQKEVNAGRYERSMGRCLNENAQSINSDVRAMTDKISADNERIKQIERNYKKSGGLFESYIEGDGAKNDFIDSHLPSKSGDKDYISYEEAKEYALNQDIANNPQVSERLKSSARGNLDALDKTIEERKNYRQGRATWSRMAGTPVEAFEPENAQRGHWYEQTLGNKNYGLSGEKYTAQTPVQVISSNGRPYLAILEETNTGQFVASEYYELEEQGGELRVKGESMDRVPGINIGNFYKTNARACINKINNPEVKYYESEPYKGMPAIVPFDVEAGWYVGTQQTIPAFGGIKAFQSSGRPTSFWVCNVGPDNEMDFFVSGFDDDDCQRFNIDTGQPLNKFACLSEEETRRIVQRAISALNEAARQRQAGKAQDYIIEIEGERVKVTSPAVDVPGTQCQDFMSPEDCKLMFNVCDPVICPSSRCNFGGQYHVADVVQSGIIGSALLCLPNYKENVLVPVCLSGIKAGIDGYLSILKSQRQCLQENLETGRHVGICDQITSVYMCEFFWRQAAPLANLLLPKVVEAAYGQGTRGGGEYLTVQSAWNNAQQSVNYFTQNYAANSFEAFNLRSVEEAGTTFCRAFVSAKAPTSFESLIEPDSPPQFHAWFDAIPFSDATVPATSQYKVFYHIFAGADRGVYYSVYLKDPVETSYFQTSQVAVVASGFVSVGQFETQTRDFTAPSGYQQLCVRINDKEECGFKQVSTSFAVNYVRDSFVASEIERTGIKTEDECVAGRTNPSALLNPNLQAAAQEAISPEVYNRGVIRVCATRNPGESTDPTRFVEVGYCSNERVKCWLDSQSVDRALSVQNVGQRESTLSKLNETLVNNIANDPNDQFRYNEGESDDINKLRENADLKKLKPGEESSLMKDIDYLFERVLINSQKAELLFTRGLVYEALTRRMFEKQETPKSVGAVSPNVPEVREEGAVAEGTSGTATNTEITSLRILVGGNEKQFYTVSDILTLEVERACPNAQVTVSSDIITNKIITLVGLDKRMARLGRLPLGSYMASVQCYRDNVNSLYGSKKEISFDIISVPSPEP